MTRTLVTETEKGDQLLVSVTTALKVIDKPGLAYWQAKETAKAAVSLARSGALRARLRKEQEDNIISSLMKAPYRTEGRSETKRGNDVHAACEQFARTRDFGDAIDDDELRPYLEQFYKWWSLYQPSIEWVELPVFNLEAGYAGTLDLVMKLNGLSLLADYKTASKAWKNGQMTRPYEEVGLQLAGLFYAPQHADFPIRVIEERGKRGYLLNEEEKEQLRPGPYHPDSVIHLDGGAVIHITPDYCRAYRVNCESMYEEFLAALRLSAWKKRSKEVIGEVIELEPW